MPFLVNVRTICCVVYTHTSDTVHGTLKCPHFVMLSGEGGGSEVEAEAEAEGVGELGGLFCGGPLLDAPACRSEVSFAPRLQMTRILWTIGSKHLSHSVAQEDGGALAAQGRFFTVILSVASPLPSPSPSPPPSPSLALQNVPPIRNKSHLRGTV